MYSIKIQSQSEYWMPHYFIKITRLEWMHFNIIPLNKTLLVATKDK